MSNIKSKKLSISKNGWTVLFESTPFLLIMSVLVYVALGVLLFGVAGRIDLPWFWATLIVFVVLHVVMVVVVFRCDPDLARERIKPGPGEPQWDRVLLSLIGLLVMANFVIAPLDVGRLHWSDTVPFSVKMLGLIGLTAGMALMTWSMAVNTFFSKVVRIQKERSHVVIKSGPYRWVRHPGYVGWILLWSSFNLALGSWLAVGISLIPSSIVLIRTQCEDRFLKQHLDGYAAYAREVRWKLIPGVW